MGNLAIQEPTFCRKNLTCEEKRKILNQIRYQTVFSILENYDCESLLDIGCGNGEFISFLDYKKKFKSIKGIDPNFYEIQKAKNLIRSNNVSIECTQASFKDCCNYSQQFDVVTCIEVIEHILFSEINSFTRTIFEIIRPKLIIVTTPNRDYNAKLKVLSINGMRHIDHKFEWDRQEFRKWASQTSSMFGYKVNFYSIGDEDLVLGPPTQMAVFVRRKTTNS